MMYLVGDQKSRINIVLILVPVIGLVPLFSYIHGNDIIIFLKVIESNFSLMFM